MTNNLPMTVEYRGKIYQVRGLFCRNPDMLLLESQTNGGSPFPAKRSDCRS